MVDDEYAVLAQHGRTLFRFDGLDAGFGNSIQFGLFSFLGKRGKQLVVSQDIYRGGNQWIVSLGRRPRVIYDGGVWLTGRESDDMSIADLDADGVYEIITPTCIFYGFESLCPACTPLPSIIFKYSERWKRYFPANRKFAALLLDGIEDREHRIRPPGSPPDNMNHLSDVLTVVGEYVFAGRERKAWTFYDRAYKLPDKKRMKARIRSVLNDSPVYRFIYQRRSRHRKN
jgi:hypothetical protein